MNTKRANAPSSANARAVYRGLRKLHPDAHCELTHKSAFELLVATVLSAQSTDVVVNRVTPHLFEAYPTAQELAVADMQDVAELLRARGLGMYNQKAKSIVSLASAIDRDHEAEVPRTLRELTALRGVGRKTANVVLGVMWGNPEGVVVDTHVQRISQRLGWSEHNDPAKVEQDLCALFDRKNWDNLSHTLIFHGRRICFARKPACSGCGVSDQCPSAFAAENVGRKAKRVRTGAAAS